MGTLFSRLSLKWKPLIKPYSVDFSLKRLVPGVDNVRFDVHLSPAIFASARKVMYHLIAKHSQANEQVYEEKKQTVIIREIDEFKRLCVEILTVALNKSKLEEEIQINYLAEAAIAKMILIETETQYDTLIENYKNFIRKQEISQKQAITDVIKVKEELAVIQKNRKMILKEAAKESFQYLSEILHENLEEIRMANFGTGLIRSDDVFLNPILYIKNVIDDFFMLEEYILLGNRLEDAIKFETVITLLRNSFTQFADIPTHGDDATEPHKTDAKTDNNGIREDDDIETLEDDKLETATKDISDAQAAADIKETSAGGHVSLMPVIDSYIMNVDNIDILFNSIQSEETYRRLKAGNSDKNKLQQLNAQINQQNRLLNSIYKQFKQKGMIEGIAASFEIQSFYRQFCPPLFPHDVINFLTNPKERQSLTAKLKRIKVGTGKPFPLKALHKYIKTIKRIKTNTQKIYLIRFLKNFARYCRDNQNHAKLKDAMDWIHLVSDPKTINLSRVNRTLYEFLLEHEQVAGEKPIINHVIIKADVRGSTDITHHISERGLNPAYYFSRNFFDPITDILSEYGASKVFIEGDAIILSISEKEKTPAGWYSVARACGLAINILLITRQYNKKNKKARLPKLEQGIGISYHPKPPAFLFDGDNRIMISPAINQADRLSGCSKAIHRLLSGTKGPFNLYVFQPKSEYSDINTVDDPYYRFNINGIELNSAGFKKLGQEIKLKHLVCEIPDLQKEKVTIYTGKFPTATGKYQRLIIREETIPEVNPEDLSIIQMTSKKYYEVCTNTKLYEYVKSKS